MARTCIRPGCDRPAVTRLSYDTISCQVWLDPLPEFAGPGQEICSLHSSRLTVPRGWSISDRQLLRPSVDAPVEDGPAEDGPVQDAPEADFASGDGVPDDGARRGRGRVARTAPLPGDTDAAAGDSDAPPAGTRAEDELPDALQATSPLLSRALRSAGRQRSVITQALGEQD
jgi:hypothetical protein